MEGASSLDRVLAYRNDDVIDAFTAAYNVSREEAEDIFREMLRFLWFCQNSDQEYLRLIDTPILIIDEMWHTFILFTKSYRDFCIAYFGRFVHHGPTTEREKRLQQRLVSPTVRTKRLEEKRARYDSIYERLGRDTFIKWYHEFPEKYSPERIREMRKGSSTT